MRFLMLAPEPFFKPRGTPFSVFHRTKALLELGHQVHLITYPMGDPVEMPGLTVERVKPVPGVRDVPIGFSWAKLPLWLRVLGAARRRLRAERFDVIHTHEDAVFVGALLARKHRTPHLYDMHSSLPQQFENYRQLDFGPFLAFARICERFALARSDAVIAICPALAETARAQGGRDPIMVIENVALAGECPAPGSQSVADWRERWGLEGHSTVIYTGTLEVNQGLDLLLDAMVLANRERSDLRLVLVGGDQDQVERWRGEVARRSLEEQVLLAGRLPPERMPEVMAAADILVSPRIIGTNTPLKIYSYLQSGRAILATDLRTHTQVLTPECAELVPPTAEGLARGLQRLAADPDRRARLGLEAQERLERHYSYEVYLRKTREICEWLEVKAGEMRR